MIRPRVEATFAFSSNAIHHGLARGTLTPGTRIVREAWDLDLLPGPAHTGWSASIADSGLSAIPNTPRNATCLTGASPSPGGSSR